MSLIKYGIGFSYLPDWGVKEALREIYQNFKDFGDYKEESHIDEESENSIVCVTLSNEFDPEGLEFLQVGKSGKRGDTSKIGEHGEGLKMAMLVLLREGFVSRIKTSLFVLESGRYSDEYIGTCFGMDVQHSNAKTESKGFTLSFSCPYQDFLDFHKVGTIKDEDVIYKDSFHGSIVRKNPGDIYVGGLFVCNLPDYKHAFDFPANRISLDRDRKIPSSWDVRYHSNNIISAWGGIAKVSELQASECAEISKIPDKVAEKFKPVLGKQGKVILQAGKTIANKEQTTALLKNPLVSKRVVKLKAKLVKKRKPYTILSEYYNGFGKHFTTNAKTELKVIIEQSKNW